MTKNNQFADYFILLLILLIAMWQLVTGIAIMKWDAMDIYLPWKNFIGESINNGMLPLWNPFMNSGFAQMGDPNTWYPVSWVLSVLGKYNIYAIHFEYLLHLYIAGIGFYKVTQLYSMSRATRIIVAAAYMLSGFLIGNAQHTGWIISAAWFPFIYYYFVQLYRKPGYIDALKLGFCSFMMFSGGYPGIFIVAFYTIFVFFIYDLFRLLIARDFKKVTRWLLPVALSAFVFFLLSAVVLIGSLDLKSHITRGAGLVFDNSNWGVLTGSLTPKALMTFVFPYTDSFNNQDYWGTDFSLVNCYIGIIPLLLLIFVNIQKNISFHIRLLSIIGLLFLLTAFAQIFPFRKWLFLFLPLMDLFRFSALFRMFAIFFFLLAAGYGLDLVFTNEKTNRKFLNYLKIILVILGLVLVVLIFHVEKWQFKQLLGGNFSGFDKIAGIKEKILLQGFIQTGMVALLYLSFRYRLKNLIFFVVLIGCTDLILCTQMNLYATVVHNFSARKVNSAFSDFPQDYPLPSLTLPMSKTSTDELRGTIPYLSQNLAIYHKIPSCDGNSPYGLYNQGKALKNKTYDAIINNPLLFLATFANKQAIVDTNTIDRKSYEKITITAFNPNLLKAKVEAVKPGVLVLLQNYYPYWKATVNGKERLILETNDTFMAIPIDKGVSSVTFEFKPVKVIFAFYLSFGSLLLLIIFFTVLVVKQQVKGRKYVQLGFTGFSVFMFALFVTLNLYGRQTNKDIYRTFKDRLSAQDCKKGVTKYIFNVDDPKGLITKDITYIQINSRIDVGQLITLLDTCSEKDIFYAQINKIKYPEVKAIITDFYPHVINEQNFGNAYYIHASKPVGVKDISNLLSFNDFEKGYPNWSKSNQVDSSVAYSGKRCFRLDSINFYSPAFAMKFSDISQNKNCVFKISLYTKFEQGASPVIVFSTRRKDKNVMWVGENVNRYFTQAVTWRKVYFLKEADSSVEPNDFVEIYVWNTGKKKVWIDDFKIELLK